MSMSCDHEQTEPEGHEMTVVNPSLGSDNNIKSDTPYIGERKPSPSVSSNMEAANRQESLSSNAKNKQSQGNREPMAQQITRLTEQPKEPEHAGDASKPESDEGNITDNKKDTKGDSQEKIDKTNGWVTVYNEYRKLDEDWVEQMDKFIDTLLVFAGLFSAVLTAFLVQVYTELQPDNVKHSAQVLLDLSNQLQALSLGQTAFASNVSLASVEQPESLIATTSLWFVSLILSLGGALFGILVKQWIREYMRWTTVFPPQHAIHIRLYRRRELDNWHVEGIVTVISECLEVGLVLFFIGLAVLLWRINATTAHITTVFVGLMLLAATITTVLPIFVLRCPYRTSFASFVLNAQVFVRRILFYARATISSIRYAFNPIVDPWWIKIPEDFLEKWHREMSTVSEDRRDSWPLVFTSWIKSDRMFCLPQDLEQSIFDRCTSLFWLTSHRTVSDDLVPQCLSDLPGTAVAIPKDGLVSEWTASDEKGRQKMRFKIYCQTLLSLMRPEDLDAELREIADLEKLLAAKLPDKTQDMNEASLPPAYKNISIYSLFSAVWKANERSRNMLSTYFFSLTKDLLGSQRLLSKDTDIDLVKSLLRILLSLWLNSDYQYARIYENVGSIDVNTDPAAQAFDCLREVYVKLLAQSEQMTSQESQGRLASIIGLLAYDFGWSSFLDVLTRANPSDINTAILMKASQCYLEYNREELSLDDAGPLDGNRRSKIQTLTQGFWEIVGPIFRSDVESHPNIPAEDCTAFLTAVEMVLQVDTRSDSRYVYYRDGRFRYLPAYVLRHLSHFPDGFVSTIQKADEGKVIDIGGMLSQFDDSDLPENLHKIRDKSAFWSALEPIQPKTKPTPNPKSAN